MDEQAIFTEALAMGSADQRAAYLEGACAGHADVRHKVEELLISHRRAGHFLDDAAAAWNAELPTADPSPPPEAPGTVIGAYKLLEQIGEGGMGLVFVAEQQHPIKRLVALKVIKPGMDSKHVIARFEAERQALALMDHPHIARILDAGTTGEPGASATGGRSEHPPVAHAPGSGRPYFVMELVRGLPITDYCDQARFTIRQRLGLFIDVCKAVQHAHTKGIIHRDLKPSNVLVTSHDGTPIPKVIDFGVAKALTQPLTEKTVYTCFAQLIGTPLYLSPEQAEFNDKGVDTQSDVYSLGVLLYELLTGTTPFDGDRLKTVDFDEFRRIIREEEPPRPSTRVTTIGNALSTVSERRQVDPRRITTELRGELDWIVMKALEKDRTRRYESAGAFARDVERYLKHEPVEACPPTAGYRAGKFVRRNGRLVAGAGVIAATLVVATGVSTWQAVEAREAQRVAEASERRAETEAAVAKEVNRFLNVDLLGQVAGAREPGQDVGEDPDLTVKEALDRAAAQVGERFQDQPLVEAAIRIAIGRAYNTLGDHRLALPHVERAAALCTERLGHDDENTLVSKEAVAATYRELFRYQAAIAISKEIFERRRASFGPDHPDTMLAAKELAAGYSAAGRWDASIPILEELAERQSRLRGPTHPDTIGTWHRLAMDYGCANRLAESLNAYAVLFDIGRLANHKSTWPFRTYAQVCQRAGQLYRAEELLHEADQIIAKQGDSRLKRMSIANTRGWQALNLVLQGRFAEAEAPIQEAIAKFEKYRPEDPRRFYWVSVWGDALLGQQKYNEAEGHLLCGYEGMKERAIHMPAGERIRLVEACTRVVRLYEAIGNQDDLARWRQELEACQRPDFYHDE